jgi:predicted metal-dependent HD superfamily phosphohydrolase
VAAHLTEELREDLLARWSEPHRRHHTLTHLHETLYEIGRDDNEDRSAGLVRELLALSPIRDEVARLVLVTKTHKVAGDDINGAVLCDADLSVLGSDALRYRTYAAAVREEYDEIPDEVFRPPRAEVLASLLDGQLFPYDAWA